MIKNENLNFLDVWLFLKKNLFLFSAGIILGFITGAALAYKAPSTYRVESSFFVAHFPLGDFELSQVIALARLAQCDSRPRLSGDVGLWQPFLVEVKKQGLAGLAMIIKVESVSHAPDGLEECHAKYIAEMSKNLENINRESISNTEQTLKQLVNNAKFSMTDNFVDLSNAIQHIPARSLSLWEHIPITKIEVDYFRYLVFGGFSGFLFGLIIALFKEAIRVVKTQIR